MHVVFLGLDEAADRPVRRGLRSGAIRCVWRQPGEWVRRLSRRAPSLVGCSDSRFRHRANQCLIASGRMSDSAAKDENGSSIGGRSHGRSIGMGCISHAREIPFQCNRKDVRGFAACSIHGVVSSALRHCVTAQHWLGRRLRRVPMAVWPLAPQGMKEPPGIEKRNDRASLATQTCAHAAARRAGERSRAWCPPRARCTGFQARAARAARAFVRRQSAPCRAVPPGCRCG
jgi:hypothetical protein